MLYVVVGRWLTEISKNRSTNKYSWSWSHCCCFCVFLVNALFRWSQAINSRTILPPQVEASHYASVTTTAPQLKGCRGFSLTSRHRRCVCVCLCVFVYTTIGLARAYSLEYVNEVGRHTLPYTEKDCRDHFAATLCSYCYVLFEQSSNAVATPTDTFCVVFFSECVCICTEFCHMSWCVWAKINCPFVFELRDYWQCWVLWFSTSTSHQVKPNRNYLLLDYYSIYEDIIIYFIFFYNAPSFLGQKKYFLPIKYW